LSPLFCPAEEFVENFENDTKSSREAVGFQPHMNLAKLLLFLALPLYVFDQITKFWTVGKFPPPWVDGDAMIWVIDGVFRLVRVHNQGVAFGFGNGSAWAPVVFLFVPIVALTMIRIFWKKGVFNHPLSQVAVALLISGIFGNLTDRLVQGFRLAELQDATFWEKLRAGYVVDFVSIHLPIYGWWPAFNVADSCICVAAVLLFIGGLRDEQLAKKKA
jgi:signal peptidase II